MTIPLGFEVASGRAVELPLRHLVVTGQTQEAGKTTTVEALIQRSGLRAITFNTKRGEGAFKDARRTQPYFREQTDWQFVASILEASRGEKLKFERAWIIRASKGARTLADVHANVRAALAKRSTGKDADVYTVLDAYLDVVVPQIDRYRWATAVDLQPGVNVMELGAMPLEMQHLIIRSTINWIHDHEFDTVIVIPEAWKFLPQGRGTPVKLAAESYIRQGAGIRNYLWLDSQDIGGVDKAILRSCPVWLLGVQREANEIKRTLDNIPAGTAKPKAAEIAQLGLGEFYACWGKHTLKVYVQPAWMKPDRARAVAMGREVGHVDAGVPAASPRALAAGQPTPPTKKEEPEMCEQHQRLQRELDQAKAEIMALREERAQAEEQEKGLAADVRRLTDAAAAAQDLGRALARLLPAAGGGEVDILRLADAVTERVMARIPVNGTGQLQVIAPEKLRKDFQREAVGRLLEAVAELPPTSKRLLKLLIAVDKRISQREAVAKLGLSWNGQNVGQFKPLQDAGLIDPTKNGTKAAVRELLERELRDYGATADEIEAVYQQVLYQLATE